jgi:hypothetical protein
MVGGVNLAAEETIKANARNHRLLPGSLTTHARRCRSTASAAVSPIASRIATL